MIVVCNTKVCSVCGIEFPATTDHFYKFKSGKYGVTGCCKKCICDKRKVYREKNLSKISSYMKDYYSIHSDTIRFNSNRRARNLRKQVISNYGGRCAVCGETNLSFLCIDHINNDGAEHRDEICGNRRSNITVYWWLKRNDFPPGFQVLCWNHNWLKHLEHTRINNKHTERCECARRVENKLRKEVIDKYGGYCFCCGEINIDLLAIDHINGNGNKHRRTISGDDFYRVLRDSDVSNDLQVLCHNCNSGRYINGGICPHEEALCHA